MPNYKNYKKNINLVLIIINDTSFWKKNLKHLNH